MNIRKMMIRMTDQKPALRPDCAEILKESNLWPFSAQQFIKDGQIQLDSEFVLLEESFHKFFIQTKLKHQNKLTEKHLCRIM